MNEIEQKQIEEMAREIQKSVDGCANYWAKLIATYLYEQGYRNVKDKVVSSKEEFDELGLVVETVQEYESDEKGQPILVKEQKILKKLQTDFTELLNQEIRELQLAQVCKGMQEENGQLRLENNDLEAENNKLKEELAKTSELKAETIKLAKQETAREILEIIKQAKENGQIYYNESFMITAQKAYGVKL
jgi:regulator of replication initiation timing